MGGSAVQLYETLIIAIYVRRYANEGEVNDFAVCVEVTSRNVLQRPSTACVTITSQNCRLE